MVKTLALKQYWCSEKKILKVGRDAQNSQENAECGHEKIVIHVCYTLKNKIVYEK